VNSTQNQKIDVPSQVPVMVLRTLLFPNSLMPLHIFEPRYREMLRTALEAERMFCVALVRPGIEQWSATEHFFHTAGLGLVRACVGRDDGTSHLILQGLTRVEFTGFLQDGPFPIAKIRELQSSPPENVEAEALTAKLLSLCAKLRKQGLGVPATLDQQLAQINDPEILSDVVAHTFLLDPFRRQDVFEELRVGERMRALIRHLTAELN
jgi:Lon protease-like protein